MARNRPPKTYKQARGDFYKILAESQKDDDVKKWTADDHIAWETEMHVCLQEMANARKKELGIFNQELVMTLVPPAKPPPTPEWKPPQ